MVFDVEEADMDNLQQAQSSQGDDRSNWIDIVSKKEMTRPTVNPIDMIEVVPLSYDVGIVTPSRNIEPSGQDSQDNAPSGQNTQEDNDIETRFVLEPRLRKYGKSTTT